MSGDEDRNGEVPSAKPRPTRRERIAMAREIEENLRIVYQASLTEDIPDRFLQLLAELRKKEGKP